MSEAVCTAVLTLAFAAYGGDPELKVLYDTHERFALRDALRTRQGIPLHRIAVALPSTTRSGPRRSSVVAAIHHSIQCPRPPRRRLIDCPDAYAQWTLSVRVVRGKDPRYEHSGPDAGNAQGFANSS